MLRAIHIVWFVHGGTHCVVRASCTGVQRWKVHKVDPQVGSSGNRVCHSGHLCVALRTLCVADFARLATEASARVLDAVCRGVWAWGVHIREQNRTRSDGLLYLCHVPVLACIYMVYTWALLPSNICHLCAL